MTHLIDTTDLLSLIWPLMLCAAAWAIMVWALGQRDQVSEAVNGLLAPRRSAEFASRSDTRLAVPSVDIGQGQPGIGGHHDLGSRRMHSGPRQRLNQQSKENRMSVRILTTAAVALIVSAGAAMAQSGPVSSACKDDLAKYCAGKSHQNRDARSCLESKKDKVSAACKSALDSTGGGKGKGMGKGKN